MPDSIAQLQSDPLIAADEARTRELYEASKTFLMRSPDPRVMWLRWSTIIGLLLLFFVGIPLLNFRGVIPDYRVNILGKYLCFAIVALGIDLIWGYTGLLSLCQALFFALGGYAMAMHLSLPEGGGQYDYPQFLTFAYVGHGQNLPWFWIPFRHLWFALAAGIAVPGIVAAIFGFFILRSRVRGVYFSIVTQALAAAAWLLISRNEMLLGGANGLTNFYRPMTQSRTWIITLYLLTLVVLVLSYLLCKAIVKSRLGRVLVAVRDKETRLYFAGYKPYAFKVFAFAVGAMLAGIGGMLYSPQVGIITPQDMEVNASIFVVVMVALGGRGKLGGAIFGTLLLSTLRSSLTSDLPMTQLLVLGVIAVAVGAFFSEGFAGLWGTMERQLASPGGLLPATLTAIPLLAVSLFVLMECLGLTPAPLNSLGHLQIYFNYKWEVIPAIFIGAGVAVYIQRHERINWMVVMLYAVAGAVVPFVFFPNESTRFEVQYKYLLVVVVPGVALAAGVYMKMLMKRATHRVAGFDLVVPLIATEKER